MTSTIKVNNIQNQCGTDIVKRCGTTTTVGSGSGNTVVVCGSTVTIGRCGGTVALASGATQSGFGREGSVNWQTGSIKTSTFTAASGEGYFVNTSGGAVTANLPAGSAGAIVSFADYTRTFQTNSLTVTPNGSEKIGGQSGNLEVSVQGQALTLVYVDGTEGWINVQNAEDTETGIPPFIQATGGTITEDGDFKVHTFTGPGTFAVTTIAPGPSGNPNVADYLVVGGGGAGGKGTSTGGGGGAGGYRFSATSYTSPSPLKAPAGLTITACTSYPITVGGGGGTGGGATDKGDTGSSSTFSTITSAGGGGGGGGPEASQPIRNGQPGGSGGGSTYGPGPTAPAVAGGSGNTPPVSPPQGTNGGVGSPQSGSHGAGGGGGFTAAGTNGDPGPAGGGDGGDGLAISITGSPVARGGGGGGGAQTGPTYDEGAGGLGGGGNGGKDASGGSPPHSSGKDGTVNTGGGGGGSGPGAAGAGGSGIVIIRYKFQ
jgi:hypothetical protein